MTTAYPIGTPGTPWGEAEKQQWAEAQVVKRSYAEDVLAKLDHVPEGLIKEQYGALPYDESRYPLIAFKSANMDSSLPTMLITGGVHGYETSGVHGAIQFMTDALSTYQGKANFVILPCLSPWGYETINRWNPLALDPNRSFYPDTPAPEPELAMAYVNGLGIAIDIHIDLHETTDTDNSEFRPALGARDGIEQAIWEIPDGFYTVADTPKPQPEFQKAIIERVRQVTHIAPSDAEGEIIGSPVLSEGVIAYDKKALFLCGGFTDAEYVTTTEVYPDSPKATAQNCNDAQVAAICGALDYYLSVKNS